jgi:hypothetical protein
MVPKIKTLQVVALLTFEAAHFGFFGIHSCVFFPHDSTEVAFTIFVIAIFS